MVDGIWFRTPIRGFLLVNHGEAIVHSLSSIDNRLSHPAEFLELDPRLEGTEQNERRLFRQFNDFTSL